MLFKLSEPKELFRKSMNTLNVINKLKPKTRSTRIVLSELLVHCLSGGAGGRGRRRLLDVFVAQNALSKLELCLLHTGARRPVDTVHLD